MKRLKNNNNNNNHGIKKITTYFCPSSISDDLPTVTNPNTFDFETTTTKKDEDVRSDDESSETEMTEKPTTIQQPQQQQQNGNANHHLNNSCIPSISVPEERRLLGEIRADPLSINRFTRLQNSMPAEDFMLMYVIGSRKKRKMSIVESNRKKKLKQLQQQS